MRSEVAQQCGDLCLILRIDASKRLIQQHHPCLLGQPPGDEGALFLASGELPDLAVLKFRELGALQGSGDDALIGAVQAAEELPVLACSAPAGYDVAHVEREVPISGLGLGNIGDRPGFRMRGADGSRAGFFQAHQRFEEGGFTGAVGADQGPDPAVGESDAHVVQRVDVAVVHAEGFGGHGFCG